MVRQCLRSLEWNVWPLGQSGSAHRLRAQLPQLHEWGARRSISQTVTEGSRARTTLQWSTTEDPEGFPNSGVYSSSSSKQGSTMLGSFDVSFWKQGRDYESVDSWAGNQEIGAILDRICCSNWFQFTAKKGREIEIKSSARPFNIACRLDHNGKLEEVSQDKKQKAVTSLLRDELHLKDLAGPFSSRASKVLGLIIRCRIAGILLHMKFASSRASRHGFTVRFLRIFSRTLYGTKISHWRCWNKRGCLNEPDSLSHYNEWSLLYKIIFFHFRVRLRWFHG